MIKSELLTEITQEQLERFIHNSNYGFQEKFNGERRTICKQGKTIRNWNREGESGKPLPVVLINALRSHPLEQFVIDVELVKSTIHVFDSLILGDETIIHDAYEYRESRYHAEFDGFSPRIIPVKTTRDDTAKIKLVIALLESHSEGVVIKNMAKSYSEGRSGNHFKLKFTRTLDAVVIGPSPEGHNSVRIGVYDERGRLYEVSGVSLRGKFQLNKLDVVEVRYLYATRSNHIVQPVLLRKRNDKRADDCLLNQLVKHKDQL